jgi:hypothetical protein
MQSNATSAAAELTAYFDTAHYAHADNVANLVLERLPSGELAWLKPCEEPAEADDALYVITDKGRRDLRMAELFGTTDDDDR